MSYGIINQCFGIDLRPDVTESIPATLFPMLRDLARLDMGSEVDDWIDDDLLEWANEISEYSYGWSAYSGSGEGPLAIGFEISSWSYWNLSGPTGIISAVKTETTRDREARLLEKWNDKVSPVIQEVLTKHGLMPDIFWTASTS
jgi:hypothetical protein